MKVLSDDETSTFPAFILISAAWYPREAQPFRMGIWFSFNGIAQILGGILSYGLGHIVSSIESWKWMFLVTGAITTIWSIIVFLLLPDNQVTAWFLDDSEKRVAIELVRNNNTGIHNKTFKPDQFKEALLDVKTWLLFFLSFLINVPNSVSSVRVPCLSQMGLLIDRVYSSAILSFKALASIPLQPHWYAVQISFTP
jgi:MFS family permease